MKLNKSRRALALGACTATAVAGLSAFGIEMATAAPDPKPIDVILGVGSTQADRTVSWSSRELTFARTVSAS